MNKKVKQREVGAITSFQDTEMSEMETRDFKRLDRVLVRGLESMVHVACALEEIRNRRLYRAEFTTFEEYCQRRLDWSRQYANRLIKAGQAWLEMETFVSKKGWALNLPSQVSVLHELAKVDGPELKVQVYEEATMDFDNPRAADVRAIVNRLLDAPGKPQKVRFLPSQRLKRALNLIDDFENSKKKGDLRKLLEELRKVLRGE